jgi:heme/copper-type cytochrome/quinol oxidase subunit 4
LKQKKGKKEKSVRCNLISEVGEIHFVYFLWLHTAKSHEWLLASKFNFIPIMATLVSLSLLRVAMQSCLTDCGASWKWT